MVGMTADSAKPLCPSCGSEDLERLISRFTRGRDEEEVLESFEDAAAVADMDDPKKMSKLMREMGRTLADDGEEDIDQLIDEVEKEAYDGTESGPDAEFA